MFALSSLLLAALVLVGGETELRQPPEPAPPPAEAPPPAPTPVRVVGFNVSGSVDPPGRLESLIDLLVPAGSALIPAGPPDETEPTGTVAHLEAALRRLGYEPTIRQLPAGQGAVRLEIQVRAADRIRQIYIKGNWPLRQQEVLRYLTLRQGQALPAPGPAREARLDQERTSVLTFLRGQGYFDALVAVKVVDHGAPPAPVDLVVEIRRGVGYPIGPIRVEGNKAIKAEEIADTFRHLDPVYLWTRPLPFKLNLMREDRTKLTERYRELGYAGARITMDHDPTLTVSQQRQVRLRLDVLELKRVEVRFEGNRHLDNDDLRGVITIFQRGYYSLGEVKASQDAIAQLYRSKGHLFVKVNSRTDGSAPEVHRITFVINEGPSLKVRQVAFEGQRSFSSGRLGEVVTARPFPPLGAIGIGEGGYASFRQLELDVERLQAFYVSAGYPDVHVRCEVAPAPGRWQALGVEVGEDRAWATSESLYVRFLIDEGQRVDITEVVFEAAEGERLPYQPSFLLESIDAKAGQPFRPGVIRNDSERLQRLLGDAGYPRASAAPDYQREANRVRLIWKLKLGPALRVGPIFVRGNFLTTESTIRRWTLLKPGDPLTTTGLERSQRNLALMQIFENATPISFPPEAEAQNVLPMLVEVEERHDHWGMVHVGAGLSTEQKRPGELVGYYGTLGYEHRNLFGQSWLLLTRGELGTSLTRVSAQFTDPRFLGTPFRLNVTGTYLRQATVRLGDVRSGGGTFGFARELFPGVDAAINYGLRNTIRTEYLVRVAGPLGEQPTVDIGTVVGSLSLALDWQRLDNPLVPSRGFRLQAGIELAEPILSANYGEDSFIKLGVRSLNVVPLTRRLGVRHTFRYDHGFPLAGASLLPQVERYSAGGDTTLRGFDLDYARVEEVRAELATNTLTPQYRPVGGNLRILQNIDLQLQIAGPWYGGVFFDTGVVADSLDDLGAQDFRHGFGVSPFVFRLPVGDISISWAWPIDPQPADSRIGRLHFNIGLMF